MEVLNKVPLKRYVLAIDFLMASSFVCNMLYLIHNCIYGENPDNIGTKSLSVVIKLGIMGTLMLFRRLRLISERSMGICFSHFIGGYLIIAAFIWAPKYFYISSEGYRMIYMSLEKMLFSINDIRSGIAFHIFGVGVWYAFCIVYGTFSGVEGSFVLGCVVFFLFCNECMNCYTIYHDTMRNLEHIRSITELKQQVQNIFKSIPEAIFVVKADLTIIMKNTAADAVFPDSTEACLKQTEIIVEDESRVRLGDRVAEVIIGGVFVDGKLGKSKVGERTYEWKASLVSWEGEAAATLLMRDVTALIQLEQAKHEAHMKNVMLRSVSHELRTPANAFTNLIERTLKCSDLPENARSFLSLAHDNCQHLLHVVNDLLDYSQFLHGSFRLAKRKFDIRHTLQSSFKPYEYMIQAAGLKAGLEIDSRLPIYGFNDPNRVSQVIMNLLSNATKFTRHGKIVITATSIEGNFLSVAVTDSGVGISHEQQANLFTLFGKLRENEGLNPQGCGLGLHISNLLARQLGGEDLSISSAQGEGSCFSFKVSLSQTDDLSEYSFEVDEDKAPISFPQFCSASKEYFGKALVVDDNVFNRDILACLLSEIGVECVTASSGYEAIQLILDQEIPFTLMFLDYEMPELNGPQTSRQLHEMLSMGKVADLPVIVAYTAYSSEKDIKECMDAGMDTYLGKPCNINEVKQIVLKYFFKSKPK